VATCSSTDAPSVATAQHVAGQVGERGIEVVAQGRPCQCLPPVAARQVGDPRQHAVDLVALGQREVDRRDVLGVGARGSRDLGDLEQAEDVEQPRGLQRELRRRAQLSISAARVRNRAARRPAAVQARSA
jgi:hypothetical protein